MLLGNKVLTSSITGEGASSTYTLQCTYRNLAMRLAIRLSSLPPNSYLVSHPKKVKQRAKPHIRLYLPSSISPHLSPPPPLFFSLPLEWENTLAPWKSFFLPLYLYLIHEPSIPMLSPSVILIKLSPASKQTFSQRVLQKAK